MKESALHTGGEPATIGHGRLSWGDSHHPALSETAGDYDGQFLFINDKPNGRLAVIDLRDLETKQIVANPIFNNNHGSTMVTPNTDYVIEGSQYAVPLGLKYAPLSQYKEVYRGLMTFWKFDRKAGSIDPSQSFAVELPPYWQDLADAGKLSSDGWVFQNSFNTEMATGGIEDGNPPFEAGGRSATWIISTSSITGPRRRPWQRAASPRSMASGSSRSRRPSPTGFSISSPNPRAPTAWTFARAESTSSSPANLILT